MKLEKTKYPSVYSQELKNGDTTYYGKYRNKDGKSVRKKLGTKKKDKLSEKQAFLMLEDIKNGEKNFNDIFDEDVVYHNYLTLSQLSHQYYEYRLRKKYDGLRGDYTDIKDYEEFKNHKMVKNKVKNVLKEQQKFNRYVGYFDIGKTSINRIKKSNVQNYLVQLHKVNISQSSKYFIVNLIKTIFNYGIKEEITSIVNPFQNVKMINPKNTRKRVLSEDELKLLLDKCKDYKRNLSVYLSVYLGVMTGARVQTILNIKKKDIDTTNKLIHLTNFKNKNLKYTIKLSSGACDWLAEKILPYYENDEYIVRQSYLKNRSNPPQPLSIIPEKVYQIMDELFNTKLNKQNNSDRDYVVNFHTIRRSIGTNLVNNGSSVYNVMKFLNHSSIAQTMDYLNLDSNDDIVDLMDNIFKG